VASNISIQDAAKIVHNLNRSFPLLPDLLEGQEEQILCPFHSDSVASARVYGQDSIYCFTCHQAWYPTSYIRDALDLNKREIVALIKDSGFTFSEPVVTDSMRGFYVEIDGVKNWDWWLDKLPAIAVLAKSSEDFFKKFDELYVKLLSAEKDITQQDLLNLLVLGEIDISTLEIL